MNFKRFFAVFKARNIEFFRDKSSLGWNLFFPVLLLAGFSFIFSGDDRPVYKVGVIVDAVGITKQNNLSSKHAFFETRHINFIDYADKALGKTKLSRHNIDLLIDFSEKCYWVNEESANSYLVEKIFLGQQKGFTRLESSGENIRYVDWVLPGVLGMNMMFSCLFGVGYVIVRYRKNSVLK